MRVHCCLTNFKDAIICIHANEPDCSLVPAEEFNWSCSVQGEIKELVPEDIPTPKGPFVAMTRHMNAP